MKLSDKQKKILYISLFVIDILLTLFLFVLSLIIIVTMPKDPISLQNATGMIGWLQQNPNIMLGVIVVPLFALLAINVGVLIWYIRSQNNKKVEVSDLSEEMKAKLKEELIRELTNKEEKYFKGGQRPPFNSLILSKYFTFL